MVFLVPFSVQHTPSHPGKTVYCIITFLLLKMGLDAILLEQKCVEIVTAGMCVVYKAFLNQW